MNLFAPPSANTRAILLLCAPLLLKRGADLPDLLSFAQYKKLAQHLRALKKQPSDLLGAQATELISTCAHLFDSERLQHLLSRGVLLTLAWERWSQRGIWVISRADEHYPARLKQQLREDAPPILYGCGSLALLDHPALAVLGSRKAQEHELKLAREAGTLCAQAQCSLVSGGAEGIDQAAMQAALAAGGRGVEVAAEQLEALSRKADRFNALQEGRLLLLSAYDPLSPFQTSHAMARNQHIYALADAALIVASDYKKGGTWAGASEQLRKKAPAIKLYIPAHGNSQGLSALYDSGAERWPEPMNAARLQEMLHTKPDTSQMDLLSAEPTPPLFNPRQELAEQLFTAVRQTISTLLTTPKQTPEVASALDVTEPQAAAWLERMHAEGCLTLLPTNNAYMLNPVQNH